MARFGLRLLQSFLILLGPIGFHHDHVATVYIIRCVKLSRMIIGRTINVNLVFKWESMLASRCISLSVMATEELVKILVLLCFVVLVCCDGDISRKDINFELAHMLNHYSEEFSNGSVNSSPTCCGDDTRQHLSLDRVTTSCFFLMS